MSTSSYLFLAALALGATCLLIWGMSYRKAEEKTYPKPKKEENENNN